MQMTTIYMRRLDDQMDIRRYLSQSRSVSAMDTGRLICSELTCVAMQALMNNPCEPEWPILPLFTY